MGKNRHDPSTTPSTGPRFREFPRWKKVLLTVAVFMLLIGLAMHVYGRLSPGGGANGRDGTPEDQRSLTLGQGQSFLPQKGDPLPEATTDSERGEVNDWSPVLMRGGMSFLLGFCVGFALRAFFRISAVFVGLVVLAVLGLDYAGAADINWVAIQEWFNTTLGSLKEQTSGFRSFVAGSIPTVGMTGVGLFTGFKKS